MRNRFPLAQLLAGALAAPCLAPAVSPASSAAAKLSLTPLAALISEFSSLDENADRLLDRSEFRAALPRRLHRTSRERRLFRETDSNRDRRISLREFGRFRKIPVPPGVRAPVDYAKRLFLRLDRDGDGFLSFAELEEWGHIPATAAGEVFAALDWNEDGRLDLEEWRHGAPRLTGPSSREFLHFVGLPLDDAIALAVSERRPWRVVRQDGVWLPVTMDYRPDRANFVVFRGIVVDASGG